MLQGKTTLDLNADHDTLTNSNDGESDCISDRNAALEEQRVREKQVIIRVPLNNNHICRMVKCTSQNAQPTDDTIEFSAIAQPDIVGV